MVKNELFQYAINIFLDAHEMNVLTTATAEFH